MAQETYFSSKGELAMPHGIPNDQSGSFLESSSYGISPREERYASPVDVPFSILKMAELNAKLASGDVDSTLLEKCMNPGSGIGIDSLVADANFLLSSGAFLQNSGNNGIDYLNLPLSPKSFLSSDLSNSAVDVSRAPQENSVADENSHLERKLQLPKIGGSAPVTESKLQNRPFLPATGMKQDSSTLIQMLKKPRIDANPDVSQEQIVQQLLPRQDVPELQDHQPQLMTLIQHHRQRMLEFLPQFCGVQAQQSEHPFSQHLQEQAPYPPSFRDDGVCSRRIQCLYNLKNQQQDNNINFWRNIVSDFYAPCAKERWCLSSYKNIGQHTLDILSLGAVGAWCCDLCGSGSGKGFEANFEVLPRLWKIKFESGVLEEILFLGFPLEHTLPSGVRLLEYDKAVQHSVYEQFRVVHEGKLRVIFRHDLKILSWEFCASHHDEYLLQRLIAPQVNHLMFVAQQYQGMLNEGTQEETVPVEKLQAYCDVFAKAGNQITRSVELPTVNELGFSKRYVRCMQIAEVLNIMRDLMTFSLNQKLGPIESMHAYCHQGINKGTHGRSIKTDKEQEKSQEGNIQNVLTNGNGSTGRNINGSTADRAGDIELLLANYYHKILRESLLNPRTTVMKPGQSHSMDTANQRAISSSFLDQQSSSPGLLHNPLLSGFPSPKSSGASKDIQHHLINKLLQNPLGKQKEQVLSEASGNIFSGLPNGARGINTLGNRSAFGNSMAAALGQANLFDSVRGNTESFRGISGSDSLGVADGNLRNIRDMEMLEFPLPEALRGMHGTGL